MKLIIHCDPDGWYHALDAARWMNNQPAEQREAVLTYGERWALYVRRNKASVTVRDCSTTSGMPTGTKP